MTDERTDSELRELWGDKWETIAPLLNAGDSLEAPVALRHRIANRSGGPAKVNRGWRVFMPLAGAACAAMVSVFIVTRSYYIVEQPRAPSDEELAYVVADLADEDPVSALSFDLIDQDVEEEDILSELL